jgi:hypothetical protein
MGLQHIFILCSLCSISFPSLVLVPCCCQLHKLPFATGTQLTSLCSKSLTPHAYAELGLRQAADLAQCAWASEGTEWEWPQKQPWSLLSWRPTSPHSCVQVLAVSRCSSMQCISPHLCSHSFKLWTQVDSCQKTAVPRCLTASSSTQATICCRLHSTEVHVFLLPQ